MAGGGGGGDKNRAWHPIFASGPVRAGEERMKCIDEPWCAGQALALREKTRNVAAWTTPLPT